MKIDCGKKEKKGWAGDEYGWKGGVMGKEEGVFNIF